MVEIVFFIEILVNVCVEIIMFVFVEEFVKFVVFIVEVFVLVV